MSNFNDQILAIRKNPKTWLITGVAGFIGSNLLEFLLKNGQKVVGLDNFSTGYKKNIELAINDARLFSNTHETPLGEFNFIEGDIRDLETCQKSTEKVEIVLHQAALGSVPRSINDPITTNEVNISGFLNMLQASRNSNVERFVYAASSSTYGDHKELPKIEDRIGNPLSPYAVTKYVNELYAQVFTRHYSIDTIGLRYFNVFGKRQDPNGAYAAVIPKWISSIMQNEETFINGDGSTSRDFCYIDNAIQINILAALSKKTESLNQIYNVAVGHQNSLNDLHKMISKELITYDKNLKVIPPVYRDFRAGDVKHSLADISKARRLLSYCPTHIFSEGLKETISYYFRENNIR